MVFFSFFTIIATVSRLDRQVPGSSVRGVQWRPSPGDMSVIGSGLLTGMRGFPSEMWSHLFTYLVWLSSEILWEVRYTSAPAYRVIGNGRMQGLVLVLLIYRVYLVRGNYCIIRLGRFGRFCLMFSCHLDAASYRLL
jgi:hypothetical protein